MPFGFEARLREVAERDRLRGGDVEHVDGAAPHTNPSTMSPENGSRLHPSAFTGTTSVWPMSRRLVRVGIAALDAGDEARPPGPRLVALDVEPGAPEILLEQIDAADLGARLDASVVDARVAG